MDKEEILARSRNENNNKDMVEEETRNQAAGLGMAVGGAVCMILSLLEVIITDHVNTGCWAVYASMLGTQFLVKYIRLRRKHELILACLWLAICLTFVGLHIRGLVRMA